MYRTLYNISKIASKEREHNQYNAYNEEIETEKCVENSAFRIANELSIMYLGSGYYKGVLRLDNTLCIKVLLNDDDAGLNCDAIKAEIILYKFIEKQHPELLSFLAPIYAYGDGFIVQPYYEDTTQERNYKYINNYLICIERLFGGIGIKFRDIRYRTDNAFVLDKNIIICDYDSWIPMKNMSLEDRLVLERITWRVAGRRIFLGKKMNI